MSAVKGRLISAVDTASSQETGSRSQGRGAGHQECSGPQVEELVAEAAAGCGTVGSHHIHHVVVSYHVYQGLRVHAC